MSDPRQIVLLWETQRAEALRILKEAGIDLKETLEDTEPSLGDFRMVAQRGMQSLFSAIESSMASTLHRTVGSGTLNEAVGDLFGKAGEAAGKSWGGEGLFGSLLGHLMTFLGRAGTKVASSQFELLRMAGAQHAATITGGQIPANTDYKAIGERYISMKNEIRAMTAEADEAIAGTASELAKVGVAFDETGAKATAYALSADKVHLLTRGTAKELEAVAITQYGESWEDAGKVIEGVAEASAYWREVAERTGSTTARALASNENVMRMYARMRDVTKGTAYEMTGLSTVFLGMTEAMRTMGIGRIEMITNATGEFLSKIAPTTNDFMGTVVQGSFLRESINMTANGRAFWKGVEELREREHLGPMLSNVALSQYLAATPGATEQFGGVVLEGIAAQRDSIHGSEEDKNTVMINRMAVQLGMGTNTAGMIVTIAQKYAELRKNGTTEKEAFAKLKMSDEGRSLERLTGRTIDDTLIQAEGIGKPALSAAESLALAAERMTILKGDSFWPAWTNVVKGALERDTLELIRPEASRTPLGEAMENAGLTQPDLQFRRSTQAKPDYKPFSHPILAGSYSVSTADGIRQVDTVLRGIAYAETRGIENPYAAIGKTVPATRSHPSGVALGKYQVMDYNLPEWSKQYLGREFTPKEFLSDPAAQEQLAGARVAQMKSKGMSDRAIYHAWIGSGPVDLGTGMSSDAYVNTAERGSRG